VAEVAFSNTGTQRRRAQWIIVGLAFILLSFVLFEAAGKHRLLMPWTLLTLGWVIGFCGVLWSEFRAPGLVWTVRLQTPCVLSCGHQQVRLYILARFPGMILLRTAQRRLWVFADETSPATWRQLLMYTRFAR
jgi:hypothetical protein